MKTEMPPSAPPSDLETIAAPPSKLDDFCRICLLRKEPLLPLTSEFNGTMIPEMLWKVSGTLLNVLEQLPRVICDRCLTKLDLAYSIAHEFRKQEELLRSFCWKGALVEQLDGFQRTEDAAKEPYSEDVLKKLAPPARRSASGSITVRDEKEMLQKIGELPPEEDTIEEATELMVEQLDDIIEIERFGEEAQSEGDQFEMIVEENSIDSGEAPNDPKDVISEYEHGEKAVNDSKDVDSEYEHGEEPEECVAFVKKELEEDEEQPKDSVDPGVLSVLVTKVEEEWIEDYDKPWEKSDHEAEDFEEPAPAAGEETEESQDPIWFDEGEREKAVDDELPKPKRRKGPAKVATKKRAIKSVTNADGLFECNICGKTFPVQKTFLNHLRRHEHIEQGSFQCNMCDKVFGTRHRLSRHEPIHTRALPCNECGQVFQNINELRSHESLHLKGKRRCRSCDFVCYTKDEMKKHHTTSECGQIAAEGKAATKPPVLRNNRCPFEGCDYVAQTYGAMYVHKRSKHQAEYECDLCDKKFAFANQLKQHETVHTGEKPFQCDICSKSFRRLFSYKEHMAVHEGEGRYECEVCGKVFARPRYLSAHVMTHSDDRPFECTMCGSSYKTNGELTKHVRAKHESLEYGNGNDLIEEDYNYFEDEIYL